MASAIRDNSEILSQAGTAKGADLVTSINKTFLADQDHWKPIYQKATEDLFFLSDDEFAQWDREDRTARTEIGRPALTVDQLSQFIHQVVNDIRMNTPSITVIPDSNDATVETAEVFKGLIKNIEYKSRASDAYDNAALFSVKSSIGFIRVDHRYADDSSFEQELYIDRIINPGAVFLDRNSIQVDGRDAKHCTILDKITLEEFKKRWPKAQPSDFQEVSRNFDQTKDDDKITVAEHFCIVETAATKSAFKAPKDDGDDVIADYQDGDEKQKSFKNKRTITTQKVMRYWLSGKEILEQTTFPGRYIPIVPVYGEESWMNGERHLFSLIRKAKNAQQMYNYWKSLETELLQKQPIAPVMAAEGQVDDYSDDWKNPGKAVVLRYKTTDADGNVIGAPQRLQPPTIPTGVVNAARETVDDIKAALGMYNASIGQRSNETSGVAINQRKQEGDVATFHFGDNLNRSICQVGNVLVFAIPEIYDTARIISITGEEGEHKKVGINGAPMQPGQAPPQPQVQPQPQQPQLPGQPPPMPQQPPVQQIGSTPPSPLPPQSDPYNLKVGKFSVDIVTGASFTTKRQEAANFFQNIVTKMPDMMMTMGDLLFKNMDFDGAQEMAARMEKIIDAKNPGLIESDDPNAPPPVDPKLMQAEQMIKQLQNIIQQGAQELQETKQQLANKQGEQQVKMAAIQAKSQTEMARVQNDNKSMQVDALDKFGKSMSDSRALDIEEQQVSGTLAIQAFSAKMDSLLQAMKQITDALPQQSEIGAPQSAANQQAIPAAVTQGGM